MGLVQRFLTDSRIFKSSTERIQRHGQSRLDHTCDLVNNTDCLFIMASVSGTQEAASEHVVLKVDVSEAGKMDKMRI